MTKLYIIFLSFFALSFFSSCQDDIYNNDKESDYSGELSLEFKGRISDGIPAYLTRNMTQPSVNVEPSEFPCYFFNEIHAPVYYENGNKNTDPKKGSKFGLYKVPTSGHGGVLQYVGEDPDKKPNWYTIDDDHFFWSWTLPWKEVKGLSVGTWGDTSKPSDPETPVIPDEPEGLITRYDEDNTSDNEGNPDDKKDPEEKENPSDNVFNPVDFLNVNPIRVRLRDTNYSEFTYREEDKEKGIPKDSSWNKDSWGNGYFFETFIGAKSGPYDFRRNGIEVPLDFRHLMSKIIVRSLLFKKADGTTAEDYKANITFINMPTEFTFYPHPDKNGTPGKDDQYMKKDGPPIVVTNQASADPNKGITFGFINPIDLLPELKLDEKSMYRDKFYICPEVDFSKVSFKVEVSDENHMKRGEYYGDFSSVAFERENNKDYDKPTDAEENVINDATILHAGEVMYFDLIVTESGGGGYTIYVRDWSDRPEQKTKHYPHPGIYVDGEAIEVAGTGSTWASKFESYGDGYWNNEVSPENPTASNPGVIHIYNDIIMGNRYTFPIDKEYVINGMGHTLTFQPTDLDRTTVTIGKMVDVYIEMNGNTIYIDREGYIYVLNKDTNKYERTDPEQRIDPTGEKGSFQIDLTTGKVS